MLVDRSAFSVVWALVYVQIRNRERNLRGKQCLVASQTLVVYAPFEQRMNPERRSSLCIQMQSGWLLLMDGCRTDVCRRYVSSEVHSRRTHFTGPSLSIACRLLSPQYRCPPSWSCRYCLCLVASMTGLVLLTSSRLTLDALRGLKTLFPPQMSPLLVGRSAHLALLFVAQFVVIWLITCWTEGLIICS